jgi:hypothetical protein
MYKHPNYPIRLFLSSLKEILDIGAAKSVFLGDINIDLQKPEGHHVLKLFRERGLESKLDIEKPSTDGGSHIDICFSNVDTLQAWFYESYYSYHKPICVVWPKV